MDLLLMYDLFEPVAKVMTLVQSISVPVWKAHRWTTMLCKWLRRAANESSEFGDMGYFPSLEENIEVYNRMILFTHVSPYVTLEIYHF
jgi:hypothetical protein